MNIVEINHLSRSYGSKQALKNVSLTVRKGEVLGVIGENGAGKTTLIKHVLGLLKAQEGTVRVFGLDPTLDPPGVLVNIGYLAEEDSLPGWLSVHEVQRYYRAFYPSWDQPYAEDLCRTFGIVRKSSVKSLSKGQRARVGLMVALSYRPGLLLLDEPSSGLDPIVRRDILGSIIRTVADDDRTVMFSSHMLAEVEQVADRVAMIKGGEIMFCDTLDAIKESHVRVTLQTNPRDQAAPNILGAFGWERHGQEWSCYHSGSRAEFEASAAKLGVTVLDYYELSLDEIFIARSQGEAVSC